VERGTLVRTRDPNSGATIQEIAMAAHGNVELPEGVEGHLDATTVYKPAEPHLSVRRLHLRRRRRPGHRQGLRAAFRRGGRLRRPHQPDDRGRPGARRPRGRDRHGADAGHGFDEDGNHLGASFMDYLLPTSMECPSWSWARP